MHRQSAVVALACALAWSPALGEPKGQKGKAEPQVRYFDLSSGIFSDLGSEVILKEVHQGTAVVAAEIEACHLSSPTSNSLDRFVVPLKVEGVRLVGTGQTQEGKQAVFVNLLRRSLANGTYTFEGTVTSGSNSEKIRSTDNSEMTEDEVTEQFLAEPAIEETPADYSVVWPQSLVLRIARTDVAGVLDALRSQTVKVVHNSLATSCRVLRSGRFSVQIDVEPERAPAVLAALRGLPGIMSAGFAGNTPNMQRAVRFPSAGFRDAAGKLDRNKLAAAVGAAVAKAMSATVSATSWDNTLGDLVIELKRPDATVAALKLNQVINVSAVVAPESPTAHQRSILWIESVTSRIVEERPAPRLEFSVTTSEDGDESQSNEPDGSDALPDAVAAALNGATWDSDNERWRQ